MPGGLRPPPSVIATWPTPNYINPKTRGDGVVIYTITFSALGIFIVGARMYSRIFITRAPGLDDALAMVSLLLAIALSILVIYSYEDWGLGRHIWDVPVNLASGNRAVTWASEWCAVLASGAIKISVLLFYKRLSAPFTKNFIIATYIGIAYNLIYLIVFVFVLSLICLPTVSYWKSFDMKWVLEGHKFHCGNESISLPASAAFSVLGDFYTTMLPLLLVRNLDLPQRQKRALYALFALGFLVVAAGIVRTYYLVYLMNDTYDTLWYLWSMWIWTLLEIYLAIIAASAPALKPFFRRFLIDPVRHHYTSSSSRQAGNSGTHGSARQRSPSPFDFRKDKLSIDSNVTGTINSRNSAQPGDLEHGIATMTGKSDYEMHVRPAHPETIPENTAISYDGRAERNRRSLSPSTGGAGLALSSSHPSSTHQSQYNRHPAISGYGLSPREVSPWDSTNPGPQAPSTLASRLAGRGFERDRRSNSGSGVGRTPPPVSSTIVGSDDWPMPDSMGLGRGDSRKTKGVRGPASVSSRDEEDEFRDDVDDDDEDEVESDEKTTNSAARDSQHQRKVIGNLDLGSPSSVGNPLSPDPYPQRQGQGVGSRRQQVLISTAEEEDEDTDSSGDVLPIQSQRTGGDLRRR